jgi:hypothetical protein
MNHFYVYASILLTDHYLTTFFGPENWPYRKYIITGGFACNRKTQRPHSTAITRKNTFRKGKKFQNQNSGTDLLKNIRRLIQELSPRGNNPWIKVYATFII